MESKALSNFPRAPGADARAHFPYFDAPRRHYLDSAASAQKPRQVIERIGTYLSHQHANIHRGAYQLSAEATEMYDSARLRVAKFLNADPRGVVFTKGATESINLVSSAIADSVSPGSSIVLSLLEHHSNIVPWQLLAKRNGLQVHYAPITPDADLDYQGFEQMVASVKPRWVACTMQSNAFGTVIDHHRVVSIARSVGASVLLDACQAAVHQRIDMREIGADVVVFSGHKVYGPTGIGVMCARSEVLETFAPYQGGGDMIETVTVEGSTWAAIPQRFEAGTPPIAEAIALGTAIDFMEAVGLPAIAKHEAELHAYALKRLAEISGITLHGPGRVGGPQCSIIPFTLDGAHPHDIATILDTVGVQVRAGHHCAMPALRALSLQSTARASLALYSLREDIDALVEGILKVRRVMKLG